MKNTYEQQLIEQPHLVLITNTDGNIEKIHSTLQEPIFLQCEMSIFDNVQFIDEVTSKTISWEAAKSIIQNHQSWNGILRFVTNNSKRWFKVTATYANFKYLYVSYDITFIYRELEDLTADLKTLRNIKYSIDEASIIAMTDTKGVITYVNDRFCQISQYARDELVGRTHRVINSGYHPKSFFKHMWDTIMKGEVWRGEVKNRAKDGSEYWMNTTIVPISDENGKLSQYVSIRTDITDRILAETALAEALQYDFRRTVKNLQNGIFKLIKNSQNDYFFTLSEGKIAEELNITTDQVQGISLKQIFSMSNYDLWDYSVSRAFEGEGNTFEVFINDRYYYISLSPVQKDNETLEVVGSMIDITERKFAEETVHYMAHYDSLTDLPNRALFMLKLEEALHYAKKHAAQLAVIFIDLDRFKTVNDTLGHTTGDLLLKVVAQRLQSYQNDQIVVSRQGGDEFTIFVNDINREQVEQMAQAIIADMTEPIMLGQMEVYITPSIGISIYPDDGTTIDKLIKNADAAMYLAKDKGKNNYQFFTKELNLSISKKLQLESEIRKALELDQFELHYQPKINLETGQVIGFEALIRWMHPHLGTISPMEFIPIAEETGFIVPIGEWVIRNACQQTKVWHNEGYSHLSVAVNISLRQFMQNDLPEVIAKVLHELDLDAKYLELEITESMAQDADYSLPTMNRIKALGVSISIDDFGTGYSSLSYLSQFPIDRLKIDQSFVRNLNEGNQAIIKTIIDMAHHMNIAVIAEGVETREHVDFLKQQKCIEVQGYYYSKPLSVHDAFQYLKMVDERNIT